MRTWLLATLLLACGSKKDDAPPPEARPAPTSPAGSVQVFVNDAPVVTIDAAKIATWPRLDSLVPSDVRKLGTWQRVGLVGEGDKPTAVDKPSDNYRDMVPVVYPGAGGAPAFGMFDPVELAKHGTAATHTDKIREIRLVVASAGGRGGNEDNAAVDSDPTKLVIDIVTPTGKSQLTGDKLLAIPREQQPGGEAKGWKLATILQAAGIASFDKLVLGDSQGTALPIEKADVSDSSIPFVKLNKQGQLRVKVYKKQGEGWTAAGDLRSMTSITVLK